MKTKILLNIKNFKERDVLFFQNFFSFLFWSLFCILSTVFLYFFFKERIKIKNFNSQYSDFLLFLKNNCPLIIFSIFFSFNSSETAKEVKEIIKIIDTTYSYIFITTIIAYLGLFAYLLIFFKIKKINKIILKLKLNEQFKSNNFSILRWNIYLKIIKNLAIIFSFFNFLTTFVSLLYGLTLLLLSFYNYFFLKWDKSIFVEKKFWKTSTFKFFLSTIVVIRIFDILKLIFTYYFEVNLDLILAIIFPLGATTIIIATYIRKIMTEELQVFKDINEINNKAVAFKLFTKYQKDSSILNDYTFIQNSPLVLKNYLLNSNKENFNPDQVIEKINQSINSYSKLIKNKKTLNYYLYKLFNNFQFSEELDIAINDLINLNNNSDFNF